MIYTAGAYDITKGVKLLDQIAGSVKDFRISRNQ